MTTKQKSWTEDNAERYQYTYRGVKTYIVVGDHHGDQAPYSVMISTSDPSINDDLYLMSLIDTIAILTSMLLRVYPTEKVLEGLTKGSRISSSIPALTRQAVETFCDNGRRKRP